MGKLWDVFCEVFKENWPRNNDIALYMDAALHSDLVLQHQATSIHSAD